MNAQELTQSLGINRVVWIDDLFSKNKRQLLKLLMEYPDVLGQLQYEPLVELTTSASEYAEFPETLAPRLQDVLDVMTDDETRAVLVTVNRHIQTLNTDAGDLSVGTIEFIQVSLNIDQVDRCSFSDAHERLGMQTEELDDVGTLYLIDLENRYDEHPEFKGGQDVLRTLVSRKSKGMPVLFSHNFGVADESKEEIRLLGELPSVEPLPFPLAAISKLQFADDAEREQRLTSALRRISVRHNIGCIARSMGTAVSSGFRLALSEINAVPTHQLDRYLVKSATHEGVSEAHVIERIISAAIKKTIKENFAADAEMPVRLAQLRAIELPAIVGEAPHEALEKFFESEVYEHGDFLNKTHAPIACGDVFESTNVQNGNGQATDPDRFILLAPPCDSMIRGKSGSNFGRRTGIVAFLARLKKLEGGEGSNGNSIKSYALPVKLEGGSWAIDFRCMAPANLAVIDWCSFNENGTMSHSASAENRPALLPGVGKRFGDAANMIGAYFDAIAEAEKSNKIESWSAFAQERRWANEFSLCLAKDLDCKKLERLCKPTYSEKSKSVAFSLRRVGRLKSPYSDTALRRLTETLSRSVFELHYLKQLDD